MLDRTDTRRTFSPGEIVTFRVSPGDARLSVVACDGVLVTVNDGADTFDLAIGDVSRPLPCGEPCRVTGRCIC